MQYLALALFATAVAASASLKPALLSKRQDTGCADPNSVYCEQQEEQYYENVCSPINATGYPDLNAPCNTAEAITAECVYGANWTTLVDPNSDSDSDSYPSTLSNSTQRDCICESQFFNEAVGCADCYTAHGAPSDVGDNAGASLLSSISSSYCAVTYTPTLGFADYLNAAATSLESTATASATASASSGFLFSDPIGNKTDVSYYFTPSVTGSAAYIVAEATVTASSGSSSGSASSGSASSSSQSLATSGGQIVPTATGASGTASGSASRSGSGSASGSASGASASSTSKSGAGKHDAAAVAGVVALAGFVAML